MIDSQNTGTGRAARHGGDPVGGARRLVGFERHYRCGSCGSERYSWTRMAACPECGEAFVGAVIRRAAVA